MIWARATHSPAACGISATVCSSIRLRITTRGYRPRPARAGRGLCRSLLACAGSAFPAVPQGAAAAETLQVDPDEVEAFRGQIEQKSYALADSTATIKTRGSAQKVFAGAAKVNHECRYAIKGIATKDFLVTPHTVPWSEDQGVRLDLSSGIRLSLLVDRAFEKGHVLINDGLANRIDWGRVGNDHVLRGQLAPCEGHTLSAPAKGARLPEYLQRHLQRRRARAATFA